MDTQNTLNDQITTQIITEKSQEVSPFKNNRIVEIEIENVQNTDIGEEEFGENESSESERESSNQSV